MTDLSYTNKDGVNLYEGFDNGFNYHRDGAAEGDGYAHGGYPEVTGETSDYTDTSYKTGDNPDFFDNGNVWVQPSVNPGPGPTPPEPVLDRIEVTTPPNRTEYFSFSMLGALNDTEKEQLQGEAVDLTGMVVTAYYSDDSSEVITDYTASPAEGDFIFNEPDAIGITYQGKQTSTPITVTAPYTDGNWLGPDDPEANDQEYINLQSIEVGESLIIGLVGARRNPDYDPTDPTSPEGYPQYLYATAEDDATTYTNTHNETFNIPAYADGGSEPSNCVVLGPISYPEEGIDIITRLS